MLGNSNPVYSNVRIIVSVFPPTLEKRNFGKRRDGFTLFWTKTYSRFSRLARFCAFQAVLGPQNRAFGCKSWIFPATSKTINRSFFALRALSGFLGFSAPPDGLDSPLRKLVRANRLPEFRAPTWTAHRNGRRARCTWTSGVADAEREHVQQGGVCPFWFLDRDTSTCTWSQSRKGQMYGRSDTVFTKKP